jgi:hypothetical protein
VTPSLVFTGGNTDVRKRFGIQKKGKTNKLCNEKTREKQNIVKQWKRM